MTTSDRPAPWPYPPTGPQLATPRPIPSPPPPFPPVPIPPPLMSLRIGHAPRLPYRVRARRLIAHLARYGCAWVLVGFACWALSMGLAGVFVATLFLASLACGQRTKTRQPRGVDAASAVGRTEGLAANSGARLDLAPAGLLSLPPG